MKDKFKEGRIKIGLLVQAEIKNQGLAIEEVERRSVSKRIIYNIIQGGGYTIDSLLAVKEVLEKNNDSFKINV